MTRKAKDGLSIRLSSSELRILYHLVKSKRRQYGHIGDQFSTEIISYCRALNRLVKKLVQKT